MPRSLLQVDAFTDRPFAGNPAGVCLLDAGDWPDDAWLQAVAAEVNVAETAFLRPTGPATWDLRWFTPTVEVDLCGHATLASAHALATHWGVEATTLRFATRSGELVARVLGGDRYTIDLPALATEAADAPTGLLEALGLVPAHVAEVRLGGGWACVVATSAEVVAELEPDQAVLAELDVHATVVTAPGDGSDDVVSRVFAPRAGIPEDPVTGSAHALVAPLWVERLDRSPLRCRQLSRRGGQLSAEVVGDRVLLTAPAVTTVVGRLADAADAP